MLRLIALLIWMPLAAFAQSFPEALSDKVNDYANLISPEAETRISDALQAARDETGVHIVVATVERQADYGGTGRFADFATQWFNAWKIGDATRNDGILMLIGRSDREMRIVLGDGFDMVWDGRAQRVIDTAMLPEFRNDNYEAGIEAGVASAVERLARPFAAKEPVTEDSGFETPFDPTIFITAAMFGLMVLGVVVAVFRDNIANGVTRWQRCPNCGARSLIRSREVLAKPGETTRGQGVIHKRCASCNDERQNFYVIPSKAEARKSSSSGSSGFGGGSSSGGGASGRW